MRPAYLACFRIESAPCRPVLGSKRRWCSQCNKAVYIAPSGLKILKEYGAKILCMECVEEKQKTEGLQLMMPTAEQLREITEDRRDDSCST